MKIYQLTINNKKIVYKLIFYNFALLLVVHCSLILVNCKNPLIIRILAPKTVSFETNGGSSIESQTVYRDYPIKRPPNPSKSGHTFDAWYSEETLELEWDFNAIPSADITLYAKWISGGGADPGDDTFSVTFDANGGILEPPPQNIANGGKVTKPADPTRNYPPEEGLYLNSIPTEYDFGGWFTEDDALWNFSNDTVSGDMTLHAKWTPPNKIPGIGEYNNIISDTISYINNPANANAGTYILLLKETATGGYAGSQIINADNFNLTIKATGPRTITYNGTADSFFTINNPAATLTLGENFTLHGNAVNVSLITVTNGTLVMETSSTITGHSGGGVRINGGNFNMNGGTINNNGSCGVYVNGGTFTMNNGTISGNYNVDGGGVCLQNGTFNMINGEITGNTAVDTGGGVRVNGGTFTMSGGAIWGNNAGYGGGGVAVDRNCTFRISKGIVYGNEAAANLRNTIPTGKEGAALLVNTDGTAEYTSGGNWIPIETTPGANNIRYTDTTINVP